MGHYAGSRLLSKLVHQGMLISDVADTGGNREAGQIGAESECEIP